MHFACLDFLLSSEKVGKWERQMKREMMEVENMDYTRRKKGGRGGFIWERSEWIKFELTN